MLYQGASVSMRVMAGDRVSWLLIRPGWKVYAADGHEVGEVNEVAGDETRDIFDGLSLATGAVGQPRYVLAETSSRSIRDQSGWR